MDQYYLQNNNITHNHIGTKLLSQQTTTPVPHHYYYPYCNSGIDTLYSKLPYQKFLHLYHILITTHTMILVARHHYHHNYYVTNYYNNIIPILRSTLPYWHQDTTTATTLSQTTITVTRTRAQTVLLVPRCNSEVWIFTLTP